MIMGDFNGDIYKLAKFRFAALRRMETSNSFRHKVTKALSSIDHIFSSLPAERTLDVADISDWNWSLSDHAPIAADFHIAVKSEKIVLELVDGDSCLMIKNALEGGRSIKSGWEKL